MTAQAAWTAILVVTAANLVLFGAWALHLRKTVMSILKEEKRRLHTEAMYEAERRAHKRVREIISSLRIQVGVQLINDSDIAWGRDDIRHHKQDAA